MTVIGRMGACIVLAVCLSGAGMSQAQPLEKELKGLLKDNPEILARQKEVESARKGVDVAIGGLLPRLDATGEIGPEHISSPLTDEGEQDWTETRQLAGVKMTQNVFDGFNRPGEVKTGAPESRSGRVHLHRHPPEHPVRGHQGLRRGSAPSARWWSCRA